LEPVWDISTLAGLVEVESHDPAPSQYGKIKETDPFVALSKQDCDMSLGGGNLGKASWKDSVGCFQRILRARKAPERLDSGELTFWKRRNGGPYSGLVAKHKIADCQIKFDGVTGKTEE